MANCKHWLDGEFTITHTGPNVCIGANTCINEVIDCDLALTALQSSSNYFRQYSTKDRIEFFKKIVIIKIIFYKYFTISLQMSKF